MTKQDARQLILCGAMNAKVCKVCPIRESCNMTLHDCYDNIRKAARVLDGDGE